MSPLSCNEMIFLRYEAPPIEYPRALARVGKSHPLASYKSILVNYQIRSFVGETLFAHCGYYFFGGGAQSSRLLWN